MMITDTGTQNPRNPTTTTCSHDDEYYEEYKTEVYERNLDEELLKEEQIQSKQGWFVANSKFKNIPYVKRIKRNIRNCLPRKIRID